VRARARGCVPCTTMRFMLNLCMPALCVCQTVTEQRCVCSMQCMDRNFEPNKQTNKLDHTFLHGQVSHTRACTHLCHVIHPMIGVRPTPLSSDAAGRGATTTTHHTTRADAAHGRSTRTATEWCISSVDHTLITLNSLFADDWPLAGCRPCEQAFEPSRVMSRIRPAS
jgi:hypothetical protein